MALPRPTPQENLDELGRLHQRWAEGWAMSLEEYAAVSQAVRDDAVKRGFALKDGSYPIMNAGMLKAAATLAASKHGDWKAALALIRKRAGDLGVKLGSLPGFASESADADAANDRAVLAAINRAIELQSGDNDSPSDAKVMAALREAKSAQEADLKEG